MEALAAQQQSMIMPKYTETVNYRDKVFGAQAPALTVSKPFPFPEIESGLEWVCHETRRIVDFGCGNGNVLFCCLSLGVEEGLGVDISTRPKGKILLKLNDYLSNSSLIGSDEYEKLSAGFYREASGLYLWNHSHEDIESNLAPDLDVERSFRVEFKQHKMWNRLYFIHRRV